MTVPHLQIVKWLNQSKIKPVGAITLRNLIRYELENQYKLVNFQNGYLIAEKPIDNKNKYRYVFIRARSQISPHAIARMRKFVTAIRNSTNIVNGWCNIFIGNELGLNAMETANSLNVDVIYFDYNNGEYRYDWKPIKREAKK